MKNTYIAILAGGKGERLWPKSRKRYPKQNLNLFGKDSIVQHTLRRARRIAPRKIFVITNAQSLKHSPKEIKRLKQSRLIIEPYGRNTAPAIGLVSLLTFREDGNSILMAMPSDHVILDDKRFYDSIGVAAKEAEKTGSIITLGISPDAPKSSYGYIGINETSCKLPAKRSYKVIKFIEKPNIQTAKKLLKSKKYFWNSGIFIFKTAVLLDILRVHMSEFYRGLVALPDVSDRAAFNKKLKSLYKATRGESLDYAVLEKSNDIRVVPSNFKWNDIGSFEALYKLLGKDRDGNASLGRFAGIDTKESLVLSSDKKMVGTIGLNNVVIVVSNDAVLVCDRGRVEEVKELVSKIKDDRRNGKFL